MPPLATKYKLRWWVVWVGIIEVGTGTGTGYLTVHTGINTGIHPNNRGATEEREIEEER